MKNILKLLSVAVVFYLLFAFANFDINFGNWDIKTRTFFAMIVIPASCLGYMLLKELDKD